MDKGLGQDKPFERMLLVIYVLQLFPASYFLPPPNNAIKLRIHSLPVD
jgi:hypothetical protein